MNDEYYVRLQCLQLANHPEVDTAEIVKRAAAFAAFALCLGVEVAEDPVPYAFSDEIPF
jgi:hypothetical protein